MAACGALGRGLRARASIRRSRSWSSARTSMAALSRMFWIGGPGMAASADRGREQEQQQRCQELLAHWVNRPQVSGSVGRQSRRPARMREETAPTDGKPLPGPTRLVRGYPEQVFEVRSPSHAFVRSRSPRRARSTLPRDDGGAAADGRGPARRSATTRPRAAWRRSSGSRPRPRPSRAARAARERGGRRRAPCRTCSARCSRSPPTRASPPSGGCCSAGPSCAEVAGALREGLQGAETAITDAAWREYLGGLRRRGGASSTEARRRGAARPRDPRAGRGAGGAAARVALPPGRLAPGPAGMGARAPAGGAVHSGPTRRDLRAAGAECITHPPGIDPLSPRNLELAPRLAGRCCARSGST